MTIAEAENILDIVSTALRDISHRHHPVSALRGYDFFQICTALKLRVANELLHLARRADFAVQFANGLKLYDGIPWQLMMFVADDQVDNIDATGAFNQVDPSSMTFRVAL